MSFTKNDQAVVLNRESLQYLANCIRLVHSLPDLLNDVLPSQTTTYSSYKVTELLNTLNTDLQNYVNNALGNLSHLKKEIVSVAPTDDSADEDTIYLVQDVSGGYEQYLKINGVVTSLGSTSVINNVYTKTESDAKFALLSTLNSLITVVGGLNDLTTTDKTSIVNAINELKSDKVNRTDIVDNLTSTDTDKPLSANRGKVLKDEVDLKANDDEVIKKTDVTTIIDDTSTNDTVPSTKAVFNSISSINGVGNLTSLVAITNLNDFKGSSFMIGRGTPSKTSYAPDGINGAFVVEFFPYDTGDRYGVQRLTLVQADNDNYSTFERSLSNNVWRSWKRVCTTTATDIPITYINTFEDETYVKPSNTNVCNYYVTNGICVIKLETACLSTTDSFVQILSGLPKPKEVTYSNAIDREMGINSGARGLFQLITNGTLRIVCNYGNSSVTGDRNFYTTISYPVA